MLLHPGALRPISRGGPSGLTPPSTAPSDRDLVCRRKNLADRQSLGGEVVISERACLVAVVEHCQPPRRRVRLASLANELQRRIHTPHRSEVAARLLLQRCDVRLELGVGANGRCIDDVHRPIATPRPPSPSRAWNPSRSDRQEAQPLLRLYTVSCALPRGRDLTLTGHDLFSPSQRTLTQPPARAAYTAVLPPTPSRSRRRATPRIPDDRCAMSRDTRCPVHSDRAGR